MKKGILKTLLSVILSLSLVFVMLVPALAVEGCACGNAPVVQVRGIGETLYDENGNEIFSTDNIINGILPEIPKLADFLLTQNIDAFVAAVSNAVNSIFGPVAYDNDMNRDSVVTVNGSNEPAETYMDLTSPQGSEQTLAVMLYEELGENHSYLFVYDWTANPFDIASDLNDFIQAVKEKSGHDKVSICAESMGGSITNTYLAVYGYDDVETVVMSNSAFNGLEMLGQLFTGNPEIDGDALARLISQSIRGNAEYESLLAYLPIFEQLALMANDIFAMAGDRLYAEVLIPIFAYIPSFWCLIPEYSYLEAMDYMLGDAGDNLKNFASSYYDIVASGTDTRVDEMVESEEVKYFNVSNYNRYIAPVTPSAKWNSDGVIETYNTSGFATCADMGETLGDNYVQVDYTDKNMISPDNVIDASTCQAPMHTWFIKNLGHIAYGIDDGTGDFYVWLLTADEQYTVESNEAYPQFMYYDTEIPMLMTFESDEEDNSGNEGEGEVTPNPDENENTENNGEGDTSTDNENNNDSNTDNENNEENNGSQNVENEEIPNTNSSYYFTPFIVVAVVTLAVSMLVIFKRRIEE